MEIHLPYILRIAITLTAFYIIYFAILKRVRIFSTNRFFLVGTMLLSFIIPLFTFSVNIATPTEMTSGYLPDIQYAQTLQSVQSNQSLWLILYNVRWSEIAFILFITGCTVSSARIIIGHLRVRRILKNCSPQLLFDHSVWVTEEELPPFTYFRRAVISSKITNSPHLQAVLQHEHIHAKGLHCIDLYLAEILCMLQWFNPSAWLFRKAIRDNLEFLTDSIVTRQICQYEYQMGMVALASRDAIFTLPAISNQSQLKKRIVMMNRTESTKLQWGKLFMLVPVLTLFTLILSCAKVNILESAENYDAIIALHNRLESGEKILSIEGNEKRADNITYIIDGEKYPPGTFDIKSVTVGDIESISVISGKASTALYGEDTKDGVVILSTKSQLTTISDKRSVAVYGEDTKDGITTLSRISQSPSVLGNSDTLSRITIRGSGNINDNSPIYIVNGKKVSSQLNRIDPNNIKEISVIKGQAAVALWGEEARNGAVVIELKLP